MCANERKCISNVDGIKFVDNNLEITQYSQVQGSEMNEPWVSGA